MPTDLSPAERAAMRERCEAATQGPWQSRGVANRQGLTCTEVVAVEADGADYSVAYVHDADPSDAEFIAHAREDLPKALDALDARDSQPIWQIPLWKCRSCGCLWRDNLDETVSLADARQTSCGMCERGPTRLVCEVTWVTARADGDLAPSEAT